MKKYLALAAFLTIGGAASLGADAPAGSPTPEEQAKRWAACQTEVQKFCANIEHGKGKMRACLEGHAAELSDGCKARMAEHHENKAN
jgi:hypothetical protein